MNRQKKKWRKYNQKEKRHEEEEKIDKVKMHLEVKAEYQESGFLSPIMKLV